MTTALFSWRDALFFTEKSVCLVVLQPGIRAWVAAVQPTPPALPHHPEHFLTGPAPGPQRCLERGALVSAATWGGLNPCITLQAVGANAITAQPGAAGAYYTHQSPLPQHTVFLVARVKAGAAPGVDKC